jgi:predicted KAP-like P-loop ATPase
MTPHRFLGDDPVDGSANSPDRLDRAAYSDHVVSLLNRVRDQSESSVLAMISPWGTGKSSVLLMLASRLRSAVPAQWIVAEFNPWMYADQDALQTGFFAELRGALPQDKRWNDVRKSLGDFGQTISPLGKLGALAGLDVSGIMSKFSQRLSGNSSVFKTKGIAEKALRTLGRPILVIMDDLDRLTPSELLLAFKLVRLVGRLPNVYYLLCYDERTLLDVLRRTDLVGDDEARARDYLEKMVQVRLDLPVIRSAQTDHLVDEAFASVLDANNIELGPDDTYRISRTYSVHLRLRLNTPRVINRLFGQVDAFYTVVVSSEIDFVDFFLITFLRTMEPGVHSLLQQHRGELTNTDYGHLLDKRSQAERAAEWRKRLGASGVLEQDVEGILQILASMFLPLRSAMNNTTYGNIYLQEIGRRRGVGHADYFDRYFTFGIPEEDISDSLVSDAMVQLQAGETGPAVAKFRDQLARDSSRVMRKLRVQLDAGVLPVPELLNVLAETYASLPVSTGLLGPEPRWGVEAFGRELIRSLDVQTGTVAIEKMALSERGVLLVARIIEGLHGDDPVEDSDTRPEHYLSWHASAQTTLTRLVMARIEPEANVSVYDVPEEVWELIWPFYRLDNSACKAWMCSNIDAGPWTLIDVISRFPSVGIETSSKRTLATRSG